jgi:hypothetical protein
MKEEGRATTSASGTELKERLSFGSYRVVFLYLLECKG